MTIKHMFLFVFLVSFCFPLFAENMNYSISPTMFELNLAEGNAGVLVISNKSSMPCRLQIEPSYFTPGQLLLGEHLKPETAGLEDISPQILVSPKVVRLAPFSKREVRYWIKPSAKTAGEYRASLVFRPQTGEVESNSTEVKGVETKMSWNLIIRVPVYATSGERGLSELAVKPEFISQGQTEEVRLWITNPTPWRYPVKFEFLGSDNSLLAARETVVLRESRCELTVSLNKKSRGGVLVRWSSYLPNVPGKPGEIRIPGSK
ncbi:MAG: hypothetical protein PHW04_15975 [Candidatus Wallbacteria bacterium]|nr:hypothetical protein [Candidatus Wallbacteria bacterium]